MKRIDTLIFLSLKNFEKNACKSTQEKVLANFFKKDIETKLIEVFFRDLGSVLYRYPSFYRVKKQTQFKTILLVTWFCDLNIERVAKKKELFTLLTSLI